MKMNVLKTACGGRLRLSYRNSTVFVNNAVIKKKKSNLFSMLSLKIHRIEHVLDSTLYPIQPYSNLYGNADARILLENFEHYAVSRHKVKKFFDSVHKFNQDDLFASYEDQTYFFVADEGMEVKGVNDIFDAKSVGNHIIRNHFLFTRPTKKDFFFETATDDQDYVASVAFIESNIGQFSKTFVKVQIVDKKKQLKKFIKSEIIMGNIPVQNGVVHIIRDPLINTPSTVEEFLELKTRTSLKNFARVIQEAGLDFYKFIKSFNSSVTILAPSNKAWNNEHVEKFISYNKERLKEIIQLHVVKSKITSDVIQDNNDHGVLEISPDQKGAKHVYFDSTSSATGKSKFSVEVGGVKATSTEPSINTGNGVLHIIDHVLGIPYQTIKEKLQSEPIFNITYRLGERLNFNKQLHETNDFRYTYFAPRDSAWERAEIMFPDTFRLLYTNKYRNTLKQILDRHLVIFNEVFTLKDLSEAENISIRLPTKKDILYMKFKEYEKGYEMEWRGEFIPIYRGDIFCTNGIIHVIDQVLIQEKDVKISGVSKSQGFSPITYLGLIILHHLSVDYSAILILFPYLLGLVLNFKSYKSFYFLMKQC